ncbi:phosphoglycerol transferase MdoB-like AlkP superfamily enzyme [Streptomyces turgidiscabies]|uniref:Phosphoglycerol transferase MdoB-like AlkP superfamily enzyme n=1 Tax=Streptomyces turgidiscabies TaxID=85558 RepID=A0ABU0RF57_9ACTN|nr:phosphoglycerol transferase MdoB-like AlkP superfamily enzyme [Streptomyces turgidiscabies]
MTRRAWSSVFSVSAVRSVRSGLRRPYGRVVVGSPLQLLLLVCSFALAGYAGVRLLADDWFGVALWFVGAALVHDLVLLPLYALADRALLRGFGAVGRRAWVQYVRVPAALSVLLLLIWFPLIRGRVAGRYEAVAGLPGDGFLARWLLITAVLFGGSAALLVWRAGWAGRSTGLRRATNERPPDVH